MVIFEVLRGVVGIVLTLGIFGAAMAGIGLSILDTERQDVEVPKLRGKEYSEAQELLKGAGLRASVAGREFDPKVPAGRVVRCKPYEGKLVKPGRKVECFLSLGPSELEVPGFVGKTVAAARLTAEREGLQLADVRKRAADKPVDIVLEQSPAAGKTVDRGTKIVLVASGGPGFGTHRTEGGDRWLFRRVRIVVPRGEPLQRVQVIVTDKDGEDTAAYDRVHKPGDEVAVRVTGKRAGGCGCWCSRRRSTAASCRRLYGRTS